MCATRYIHEHYPEIRVIQVALPDAYVEHGNVSLLREMLGIDSDSVIGRLERSIESREEHEMPEAECRTEEQPGTEKETDAARNGRKPKGFRADRRRKLLQRKRSVRIHERTAGCAACKAEPGGIQGKGQGHYYVRHRLCGRTEGG